MVYRSPKTVASVARMFRGPYSSNPCAFASARYQWRSKRVSVRARTAAAPEEGPTEDHWRQFALPQAPLMLPALRQLSLLISRLALIRSTLFDSGRDLHSTALLDESFQLL